VAFPGAHPAPGLGCKGVFGALTDKAPLIFRARYRDSSGKEHLKRFALKRDAQRWLDTDTKTTLDAYGHLWPDSDDTMRAAVSAAILRPVKAAIEQRP
jgi:hypothetical protein